MAEDKRPPLFEAVGVFVEARCPACADYIDYCQGHGEIGDPHGRHILDMHDDGDHSECATECE